ncbi:dihydrodipicolinate synthase family protein [Roseomonas sp. SSH11]|uniref:Dihydrodipicolinate synthase family protein n=1 Tax=Pararoseomonas baculiformis TaxID=2820812 RepID=A0ABS4AI12_9PROT|nr:dihydrodipicolinate synthase family protein [Pararoseomonas baculiformis]MBP0446677.1 dihydrodipicolinate synthase family protein [Pararoseomonas baculiformis]
MTDALYAGVNAALITAVHADLSPDHRRTAHLAKWLLANGCNSIGVLGTTGEANSFGLNERREILEKLARNGIPVARMMPGTGFTNITDTVEMSRHARDLGCPGVLVLPPFYYKNPSEDGLFAYYSEVIERIGGGLAIYLYHFPAQSAVPLTVELVGRLIEAFPGVVRGIKDSTGDAAQTEAYIRAFASRGFEVYPGGDSLFQRMLGLGAAGCITAATNLSCRFAQQVYTHRTGPEADAGQAMMNSCRAAAGTVPLIPGLREIIARSTGDDGWRQIRPPHTRLTREEADRVWAAWQATGALPLPGLEDAGLLRDAA